MSSKKHSNKNRTIIAGDFKLEFDNLKAVFNLMDEEEQGEVEKKICELTHLQILEAIASNALKKIGSYVDPMTNKHLLLLGS